MMQTTKIVHPDVKATLDLVIDTIQSMVDTRQEEIRDVARRNDAGLLSLTGKAAGLGDAMRLTAQISVLRELKEVFFRTQSHLKVSDDKTQESDY